MVGLVDRWGNHPAVFAMEPVNEPSESSDMPTLRSFYRRVRDLMRTKAPHLYFVFYAAIWDRDEWGDLFEDTDIDHVIMDTHMYSAWSSMKDNIDAVIDDFRQ